MADVVACDVCGKVFVKGTEGTDSLNSPDLDGVRDNCNNHDTPETEDTATEEKE